MKDMLERVSKENADNYANIKYQNEQIADLTKKLEKRPLKASNKCSQSKESHQESNHSENSNKEYKSKKDLSMHSLSIEQIQSLVADAVKLQLGEGSCRLTIMASFIQKKLILSICILDINL